MNATTRNPSTGRPVANFVDVAEIVGKSAAEIRDAHKEIASLRKRAEAYTPLAAQAAFNAERARLMEDGAMTDAELKELGTPDTWAKQYKQSAELLFEAARRRPVLAFEKFRSVYAKIENELAALHKRAEALERDFAKRAGIEYAPSSGVLSLSDTLVVFRRRMERADENPEQAPALSEYFAEILK